MKLSKQDQTIAIQRVVPRTEWAYQETDERDYLIFLARVSGTLQTRTLGHWEVTIGHNAGHPNRGYFEHDETGDGGSLWFEGRCLVDFDGLFDLPVAVKTALADLGYVLDWTLTGAPPPGRELITR